MSDFYLKLIKEINRLSSQKFDEASVSKFRHGVGPRVKLIHCFQVFMRKLTLFFSYLSRGYLSRYDPSILMLDQGNYYVNNIQSFERAYEKMGDDASGDRYVNYVSFNYVRRYGARLPFDMESFDVYESEFLADREQGRYQKVSVNGRNIYLPLEPIGFVINFKLQQYAYQDKVVVECDDIVLDCGAANGDTALYFAALGAKTVYSFEFTRDNIIKFNEVMTQNGDLKNSIELVERALWDKSNIDLNFSENGNATSVQECSLKGGDIVKTITIDDFIRQNESRVDFIKMDIEGAELNALKGARETILKYKPKLAICVYHKDDDLVSIPDFINSLDCGYELYFDYYTDTGAEAVLYARVLDS